MLHRTRYQVAPIARPRRARRSDHATRRALQACAAGAVAPGAVHAARHATMRASPRSRQAPALSHCRRLACYLLGARHNVDRVATLSHARRAAGATMATRGELASDRGRQTTGAGDRAPARESNVKPYALHTRRRRRGAAAALTGIEAAATLPGKRSPGAPLARQPRTYAARATPRATLARRRLPRAAPLAR